MVKLGQLSKRAHDSIELYWVIEKERKFGRMCSGMRKWVKNDVFLRRIKGSGKFCSIGN
jgi:hypothetical protein